MNILTNFSNEEKIFLFYLIVINIITLLTFLVDKLKAKKDSWRISENTLLLLSILGGSSGALLGMVLLRHKINKIKFTIAIPITFIIHKILEVFIFNHFSLTIEPFP